MRLEHTNGRVHRVFWSMKETYRLRIVRRIIGGLNVILGAILVAEQVGALGFGLFSQPKPRMLAVGVCLVISGLGLYFMQPRPSSGDEG